LSAGALAKAEAPPRTVTDISRRYLISGRVQGVGFRYFVQEAGQREGVRGWVRNLADGRVEAFAVGSPDAIERFEARVRNGSAMSRVADVDVVDAPPGFDGADFEVRASSS
jgi:acylphosphatase